MHISDLGYKLLLKVYSHWDSIFYKTGLCCQNENCYVLAKRRGFSQNNLLNEDIYKVRSFPQIFWGGGDTQNPVTKTWITGYFFFSSHYPHPIYSNQLKMKQFPWVSSTLTASQGRTSNKHKHQYHNSVRGLHLGKLHPSVAAFPPGTPMKFVLAKQHFGKLRTSTDLQHWCKRPPGKRSHKPSSCMFTFSQKNWNCGYFVKVCPTEVNYSIL